MNKKILENLVGINSVFPQEKKVGDYLYSSLKDLGFDVIKQKVMVQRYNILAQKGQGKNALLIFGHLDTVSITDKTKWKTDPFVLTTNGDRLYGLGAWDMKGGIASILTAVKDFEPNNYKLKLAFVVDEENYSLGMGVYFRSQFSGNSRPRRRWIQQSC